MQQGVRHKYSEKGTPVALVFFGLGQGENNLGTFSWKWSKFIAQRTTKNVITKRLKNSIFCPNKGNKVKRNKKRQKVY